MLRINSGASSRVTSLPVTMKIFLLLCLVPLLRAEQKCHPDAHGVRRFNGKPCASTTRYSDGLRGACGCGPGGDTPFNWAVHTELTTAPNQKYFDFGGDSTWCGRRCGHCVRLTPTGGFVPGQGAAPPNHAAHIFLVTNDCPINGNYEWCGQSGAPGTHAVNTKGYEVHFDLQNAGGQINNLHWDNPEVTWEEVACPGHLANLYHQCQCPRG